PHRLLLSSLISPHYSVTRIHDLAFQHELHCKLRNNSTSAIKSSHIHGRILGICRRTISEPPVKFCPILSTRHCNPLPKRFCGTVGLGPAGGSSMTQKSPITTRSSRPIRCRKIWTRKSNAFSTS